MKKFVTGLLAAVIAVTLSGCYSLDSEQYGTAVNSYVFSTMLNESELRYVDPACSDSFDKCFTDFTVNTLTLSLPLRVCDLPDGYMLETSVYNGEEGYTEIAAKNQLFGYCYARYRLIDSDGVEAADCIVLTAEGEPPENGTIVCIEPVTLANYWSTSVGLDLASTMNDVSRLLGDSYVTFIGGRIYLKEDGRVIIVYCNINKENYLNELYSPYAVSLSVHPEACAVYYSN